MTREELIRRLTGRPESGCALPTDFATRLADEVELSGAFGLLYDAATAPPADLPKAQRHAIVFRAAWVVERIYFRAPERFAPWCARFCTHDFAAATDPSARRSFGKMMADLLGRHDPGTEALDRIASAAAEWLIDPRTKVAVRIYAIELLGRCRQRLPWVAEAWGDLLAAATADATPAIASRMRNRWNRVF